MQELPSRKYWATNQSRIVKALITWSMVVDMEPEEVPEFAANVEKKAMESMHEAFDGAERPLDKDEAKEFHKRFQFYGVSYSVRQKVEPPVA